MSNISGLVKKMTEEELKALAEDGDDALILLDWLIALMLDYLVESDKDE